MSDFTPYVMSTEGMIRARGERMHARNEILAAATSFPTPIALLSFGMNIPDAVKQTPLIRSGFLFGRERLAAPLRREDYVLLRARELHHVNGDSWLCLASTPPESVRHLAVALEDDEPLTWLPDVDTLNCEGQKLSREGFFLPLRHCPLCEKAAVVCARSRTHSMEALFSRYDSLLQEAFSPSAPFFSALENHTAPSFLDEVYATPKPGLVDCISPDVHADIELEDFTLSTAVITLFLREVAATTYQSCLTLLGVAREAGTALFPRLREIGRRVKSEMYVAASGANTHKGAVFILELLSAGAGLPYAGNSKLSAEIILDEVQSLVGDTLRQELADLKAEGVGRAHGEAILYCDDMGDVHNTAAEGFPVFRNVALLLSRQYEAEGRPAGASVLNVLLHPILHVSDAGVLYYGGEDALFTLRVNYCNILSHNDAFASEGIDLFYELREACEQQNVSPGGAVDLLSVALFLHWLEKAFRRQLLLSVPFYIGLMARD